MPTDLKTEQIYSIVNKLSKQMLGREAIDVVDTNSLVTLGNKILSSSSLTENFTNTLVLRIARTIVSFRRYESKLKPLVFDTLRWGAIVQKIKVEMPEAEEDKAYDLVDGESVDMYVVKKPTVKQKFFVNRTPYSFRVTIQRWQLMRAFTGEEEFGAFISAIYGEIRNKLELTFEELGYAAMNNFIVNLDGTTQIIDLVSLYNTMRGKSLTTGISALGDSDFLRFAVSRMNIYAQRLTEMSTLYNSEGYTRHTPIKFQRFIMNAEYSEAMKTVVEWEAFHSEYVTKAANIEITRWQSPESPLEIMGTNQLGANVTMDNVIAFIHDRDALGTYRKEDEVLTTPVNARGRYTNTFWHEEQMWFNDLSENAVVFTLN